MTKKRRVAVLGSTGSIGRQALAVIKSHPELFEVSVISGFSNSDLILKQISEFNPACAVCPGLNSGKIQNTTVIGDVAALSSPELYSDTDVVLNGISGLSGFSPSIAALQSTAKVLASANKESIAAGGNFIKDIAKKNNKIIIPVDSEHSTVYRLIGERKAAGIILTASGGAFRNLSKDEITRVSGNDALNHPTWKMGKKVTVDSATLMNKGFEIIEAVRLFDTYDVDVLIEKTSVCHAIIKYSDGFYSLGLSATDMRLPIQYALSAPDIHTTEAETLDLCSITNLKFERPDENKFPCLRIGREVSKMPELSTVVIAADEVAVDLFLKDKLSFYGVSDLIENALNKFRNCVPVNPDDIFRIEKEVTEYTLSIALNGGTI